MKITLNYDYAHELIDLLKVLSKNLKEDEPVCSLDFEIDTSFLDSFNEHRESNKNIKTTS
jgi:hypothetical protein